MKKILVWLDHLIHPYKCIYNSAWTILGELKCTKCNRVIASKHYSIDDYTIVIYLNRPYLKYDKEKRKSIIIDKKEKKDDISFKEDQISSSKN